VEKSESRRSIDLLDFIACVCVWLAALACSEEMAPACAAPIWCSSMQRTFYALCVCATDDECFVHDFKETSGARVPIGCRAEGADLRAAFRQASTRAEFPSAAASGFARIMFPRV
jgi:hypothetical protein